MTALGQQRSLAILSAKLPLTGVKRKLLTLKIPILMGRRQPQAAVREYIGNNRAKKRMHLALSIGSQEQDRAPLVPKTTYAPIPQSEH